MASSSSSLSAAELGGFGFRHGDGLFNVDTLKFFEAMIALDKGAVLTPLREGRERHVVWEIGAGWGGLAYTFKTPLPQQLLRDRRSSSGVPVLGGLPDDGDAGRALRVPWRGSARVAGAARTTSCSCRTGPLDELDLPRLDLTLNMVSFQEMTTAQVEAIRRRGLEARLADTSTASTATGRTTTPSCRAWARSSSGRFWPHEIPVLGMSYTELPGKVKKAKPPGTAAKLKSAGKKVKQKAARDSDGIRRDYRHIVGWRRQTG